MKAQWTNQWVWHRNHMLITDFCTATLDECSDSPILIHRQIFWLYGKYQASNALLITTVHGTGKHIISFPSFLHFLCCSVFVLHRSYWIECKTTTKIWGKSKNEVNLELWAWHCSNQRESQKHSSDEELANISATTTYLIATANRWKLLSIDNK